MLLDNLNKILIIRLSSLGDILLTTPVIRAIKKFKPSIQIDFITKPQFGDVLTYNEHLTNKFVLEQNGNSEKLINTLRQANYDLVVDLQNNFRSFMLRRKLNVPAVKYSKPTLQKILLVKFKWNAYKNIKSIVQLYAEAIPELKLDDYGLDFYNENGKLTKQTTNEKYIGFCPGSKHFTKQWPKEHFIELGNTLLIHKYKIKLLGGAEDLQLCEEIAAKIPGALNECTDNDIFATAKNMSECEYIVSNDSGLMHLASALNLYLFAIFGSTVKEFGFYPYKCENYVFANFIEKCRPCSHIGRSKCPKGHFNCMKNIKPDRIVDKIFYMNYNG